MIDDKTLRDFAQGIIADKDLAVARSGVAGAAFEICRAAVAQELLDLLAARPAPTSAERIPARLKADMDQYTTIGLRPGSCLLAVLSYDLQSAFDRADPATLAAMLAIVAYVRCQMPAASHGSPQAVEDWIRRVRS